MGLHTGDNKFMITTESETVHFNLPKDVDNNLQQEIDSITKHDLLAEHTISTRLLDNCPNISM